MKIVFLDASTVGDVPNLDSLKEMGDVTLYPVTRPDETEERIRDAEVIITNKVVLDRKLMSGAANLKLICVAATGMNNIDREAAEELGIPVKNVAGYASNSVAQSTFAMVLHLMQGISYYDRYIKSGEYSKSPIFTHLGRPFHEIAGKQFGIIGLGSIGRRVASIAEAFGANVVYYSTTGKNTDQPYALLGLTELLKSSDFVSVHAPLNEQTENLIGYKEMKQMKSSALLINTGRGGIVNEEDLVRAIDEKLIAGAALDVFEKEPLPSDHPLLRVQNPERLLMTPHMTWSSVEARTELIEGVKSNIEEFGQRS
ncbi:D-2-hydroxyacid dehydrogenase [Rhodohalobacter mucosus]|uniref:D-2-hydroxyacid dehydrogenase n=1 Tax=Rhodohalobacter mucosus TaxID=2079485 RepID=A0A316TNV0_9BACT|nr:D-2-hydroxyacid dehydrogenase [Rhodohalobacter mucosus]PWN06293.1 D-2-hydroxyacid dehydrogenase [Rhodohalobacter mucosus]